MKYLNFSVPCTHNRSCRIYKKSERVVMYTVSRYPANSYGERIRQRRLELGLTQVDLAKLLEVSEMSVVGWDKGWQLPRVNIENRPSPFEQ